MIRGVVVALILILTLTGTAFAAKGTERRRVCASRQARYYVPLTDISDWPRFWEVNVCAWVEYDGATIKAVEKPTASFDTAPGAGILWTAENCTAWNINRSDGTLWVHGECKVSWRVWLGPLPIAVGIWTVAQEFTVGVDGFQDIFYPALWRGQVGESPVTVE